MERKAIPPPFFFFLSSHVKIILKSNRMHVLGSLPLHLGDWKSGVVAKAETRGWPLWDLSLVHFLNTCMQMHAHMPPCWMGKYCHAESHSFILLFLHYQLQKPLSFAGWRCPSSLREKGRPHRNGNTSLHWLLWSKSMKEYESLTRDLS